MDVDGGVYNGALSQYGWVPQVRRIYFSNALNEDICDSLHLLSQCTDISVTPKNGTPPYTFEVRSIHGFPISSVWFWKSALSDNEPLTLTRSLQAVTHH